LYHDDPYIAPSHSSPPCFSGFSITTEDGTKYVFGGNINAIDFSDNLYGTMWDWTATAWYLTKIILPNKQAINFTYERKEYVNQMYISVHLNLSTKMIDSSNDIVKVSSCSSNDQILPIFYHYRGQILSPVYLKEISTVNTTVSFAKSVSNELRYKQSVYSIALNSWTKNHSYESFLSILTAYTDLQGYPANLAKFQWYQLDSITIKSPTEIVKTIDFGYSNSSSQRLTLNEVTESGNKPYTFLYNKIDSLPDYLDNKSDHWGFYNGTDAPINDDLIDDTLQYYLNRNPHPIYTKYGVLSKITYPTGGYTEFEFEPHDYKKQLNLHRWELPLKVESSNQLAGGVRIKRITSTSDGNFPLVKDYYYVSDYLQNKTNASLSSGILGGQTKYCYTDYTAYDSDSDKRKVIKSVFSSNSVLPSCQNISGSHIGYTEVIEKRQDESFIRYKFTNFDNGYMDEPADAVLQATRTAYEPYTSKSHERGQMILQEDYNSTGKKVKSKIIAYESDNTDYVRSMQAAGLTMCPEKQGAGTYIEGTSHRIYTSLLRPIAETETLYDPITEQKLQEQKVNYTYNSRKLLSTTSMLRSDAKIQTTTLRYPFDITSGPNWLIFQSMTEKNILSNYVEKLLFVDDCVVGGEHRLYNPVVFQPMQISSLQLNAPIPKDQFYINQSNSQQLNLNISSEAPDSEGKIYDSQTFSIMYPARIQMEVFLSEKWADMYNSFTGFVIEIKDEYTNASVFRKDVRTIEMNRPYPSYYTYDDFLYVETLPAGSYKIDLSYYSNWEYNPKEDDYNSIDHWGQINVEIEEQYQSMTVPFKPEMYYKYNTQGNMIESKSAGSNVATTYLWGYKSQYPVAKIENATVEQVRTALGGQTSVDAIANSYTLSSSQLNTLNNLRSNATLSNAMVTTYTYKPLIGIETITDPRGVTITYQYDSFGRLQNIVDDKGKTVENYNYHYKNQ
jgi:YD repeat-containing protein